MTWRRGEVVAAIVPGDIGKPPPVVIVQADAFLAHHASVTVCPLTTHLLGLRLFRVAVATDEGNGLNELSEVMADKVGSLRRERIGPSIGRLSAFDVKALDEALRQWLSLGEA
jgi:mRNA interferase MazF